MQIICRGSKLWQLSTCSVITIHTYIQVLLQAGNSMTGRAHIGEGEVLIQVWLKSELLDEQLNAQKENILPGFMKAPASPQKSVQ